MADLIIRIAGETSNFVDAMDEVSSETDALQSKLGTLTKVSGVAFAALTAGVGFSVAAFREAEQTGLRLEAVLKATGGAAGVTSKQVLDLASKLQGVTTFGDEAIATGTGILLTFGRIGGEVIPRATEAMLDLATKMGGDTSGAAQLLGRALNDPIDGLAALSRQGIKFTDQQKQMIEALVASGKVAEAQAVILEELEGHIGGIAVAAAGGTGAFLQLKEAFGDVQEEIGSYFAPALIASAEGLKEVMVWVKDHPFVTKLAASFIAAGIAVSGLGVALGVVASAVITVTNLLSVFGVAAGAASIAVQGLVAATVLGALVIILTQLYFHWDSVVKVGQRFKEMITGTGAALKKEIYGPAEEFGPATLAVQEEYAKKALKAKQDALVKEQQIKDQAAKEKMDKQIQSDLLEEAEKQAHLEKLQAKDRGASEDYIKLLQETLDVQKAMITTHNEEELAILETRFESLQAQLREQDQIDLERRKTFNEEVLTQNAEYNALTEEEQKAFLARNAAALQNSIQTEATSRQKATAESIKKQIEANNTFIEEKKRYGEVYATLNRIMHETEYQNAKSAVGDLAQLQQSKSATLKAIGKAATIANIIMSTQESAMRMIAGFSTIPIIGPALGYAAAAAVIAYGAGRIGEVVGLNEGGIVSGGQRGRDSVPAMLTPGELIVPEKNFEEVVNATAAERAANNAGTGRAGVVAQGAVGPSEVRVYIDMSRDASRFLTAKQNEDRALGISREVS